MKPASMAKVMTAYIVFDRIKDRGLQMSDTFVVSDKAWRWGGSRTNGREHLQIPFAALQWIQSVTKTGLGLFVGRFF